MTKLFEAFPQELKEEVVSFRLTKKKKGKNTRKLSKKRYAFEKIKKLPLESERNVISAMNHFANVKGASEEERAQAYEKIIKVAELFKICTMGFREKYSQHSLSTNESHVK